MGAWGFQLFEGDHDYDFVDQLTVDADLHSDDNEKREWLLHPLHPDKVREMLDNGLLVQVINKYNAMLKGQQPIDPNLVDSPRYHLLCLCMIAMELGCKIPKKFRKWLVAHYPDLELNKEKEEQVKRALRVYKNGDPIDLGSKGLYDTMYADDPSQKSSRIPGMVSVPDDSFFKAFTRNEKDAKIAERSKANTSTSDRANSSANTGKKDTGKEDKAVREKQDSPALTEEQARLFMVFIVLLAAKTNYVVGSTRGRG